MSAFDFEAYDRQHARPRGGWDFVDRHRWVLLVLALLALLTMLAVTGGHKKRDCTQAGGVWITREQVCVRGQVIHP